ncbi:MAG: hypothetical protein K2Y37_23490 [Pirellulales bacterium]|nr:hypothetical protein [Pirellulales bacterium]
MSVAMPTAQPQRAGDQAGMRRGPSPRLTVVGIVVGLLMIYHANGDFLPGRDSVANAWLPVNLLGEGQLVFRPSRMPYLFDWRLAAGGQIVRFARWDEPLAGSTAAALYRDRRLVLSGPGYYLYPTQRVDARSGERLYANTFGLGAGITALPVIAPLRLVARDLRAHPKLVWYAAKFAAALAVALSAALLYLTMLRFVRPPIALVSSLAYGLGTCVWSTSSQALWQHGPSELFLALGLYCLVSERANAVAATFGGSALAMAVACRPTNAVVVAVVVAWLAIRDRRALLLLFLGALPIGLSLPAYNAYYQGSPVSSGQVEIAETLARYKCGTPGVWQTPLWFGAAGLLASPGRGLFVYSPWLLLSLWGSVLAWRNRRWALLRPLPIAALVMLAVHGKFYDWWGGWAFGYRPIVDSTVLLTPLAAIGLESLVEPQRRVARRLVCGALAVALAWSIGVQTLGAFAYDLAGWNAKLVDGVRQDIDRPEYRHRLWSWRDNPIFYYATHFAESRQQRALRVQAMCEQPG